MQVPLDITFENSEPSEAIRSEVEKQAKRLEKFSDRVTSCHVAVIAPQARHRKGGLFKIDIRIAMPDHKDIIVNKTHGDAREHEHVLVAIKDAFSAAQRQIEGLTQAAVHRGWPCRCFLTGAGVRLLRSAKLLEMARGGAIRLDVCEHSWQQFGDGPLPAGAIAGSQYQNAELAHLCDRVVVL